MHYFMRARQHGKSFFCTCFSFSDTAVCYLSPALRAVLHSFISVQKPVLCKCTRLDKRQVERPSEVLSEGSRPAEGLLLYSWIYLRFLRYFKIYGAHISRFLSYLSFTILLDDNQKSGNAARVASPSSRSSSRAKPLASNTFCPAPFTRHVHPSSSAKNQSNSSSFRFIPLILHGKRFCTLVVLLVVNQIVVGLRQKVLPARLLQHCTVGGDKLNGYLRSLHWS